MVKQTFSIFKEKFTQTDLDRIDPRIKKYLDGWKLVELYKGKVVTLPPDWNSEIFPYKYCEVYKDANSPNPGEEENEIQLYLSCGWRGYDDEVVIVLMIVGTNVLNGTDKVSAEIHKMSGASMKLYKNNKLITDFTKQSFWRKESLDKVWIERLD